MREYARVSPAFWIGETGRWLRALPANERATTQLVALYLLTNPHANMIGLYYLPISFVCHETGCSIDGASKALRRLSDGGFAYFDGRTEVIWVAQMAKFQIGRELKADDKQCKGVQNAYDAAPENPYLERFFEHYKVAFNLTKKRESKPNLDVCEEGQPEAPSKPLRSKATATATEQEQEKATEQEDLKRPRVARPARPTADAKAEPWLEPLAVIWREHYGSDPHFGILGKVVKPLVAEYGIDTVCCHLANYLASTEPQFVSLPKWGSTFAAWVEPQRSRNGPAAMQSMDSVGDFLRAEGVK